MKLISLTQDLATSTQVDALFKPLQMALSRVSTGVFLLNQHFKRLGQQPRDRSLALYCEQLDLEQDFFGNRESDVLCFHCFLHVNKCITETREGQRQRRHSKRVNVLPLPGTPSLSTWIYPRWFLEIANPVVHDQHSNCGPQQETRHTDTCGERAVAVERYHRGRRLGLTRAARVFVVGSRNATQS